MADIVDRNAEWAEIFKGSATGSQRRRYADDIAQASQRTKQREAEEFEALQLRKPEVGRLMLDRQQEERTARENRLKRDFEERKFAWDQEKDVIAQEVGELRQEREMAMERRLLNQAKRDELNDLRKQEQTFAVQEYVQGMIDKGEMPGSAKFAYGAAEVLRQNPFVDPGYRSLLVGDARILQSPEDAAAALADGATVTRTTDKDGNPKFTITQRPPKDEEKSDALKERSFATSRMDKLEKVLSAIPEDRRNTPEFQDLNKELQEFRQRSKEADAKIRGEAQKSTTEQPSKVRMKSPDGEIRFVDPASVEKYKSKGATIVD